MQVEGLFIEYPKIRKAENRQLESFCLIMECKFSLVEVPSVCGGGGGGGMSLFWSKVQGNRQVWGFPEGWVPAMPFTDKNQFLCIVI